MEGQQVALVCVLWSIFSVTECVWGNGTRLQRSEACPEGLYEAQNGFRCCLCPKGYYLETDCSSPEGTPVCFLCGSGTYVDHVNSERKCELCKKCSSNENMEEDTPCSVYSNTVCRCQEGHYCHRGDQCKVCYLCSTCEGLGVKSPCTLTNDIECNEEPPAVLSTGIIVVIIVVIATLSLAVVLAVVLLRRKKMLCFKSSETPETSEVVLKLLNYDDDLLLEPFLPGIAEILGFKVVRNVVKRQGLLSQSKVDNIMDENPHDANERAHQLLLAWYEKHGMKGAYRTLIDNLVAIHLIVEAEKVHKFIRDGQSNGQNGDV